MMWEIVGTVVAAYIGLPILAYLMMKFGTAGYLRALDRHKRNQNKTEH